MSRLLHRFLVACVLAMTSAGLLGCGTPTKAVLASESQVRLRSIQSRRFDTSDKTKTLRAVMATLQDLGFVIDKADNILGIVSATKLRGYQMRITVTVKPYGESQLLVRANAQYNLRAIEEPEPYQQFFAALEKAMFLTAQNVE